MESKAVFVLFCMAQIKNSLVIFWLTSWPDHYCFFLTLQKGGNRKSQKSPCLIGKWWKRILYTSNLDFQMFFFWNMRAGDLFRMLKTWPENIPVGIVTSNPSLPNDTFWGSMLLRTQKQTSPRRSPRSRGSKHLTRYSSWWQLKFFLMFTPKFGEDSHFDSYFSDGLVQPPTSIWMYLEDLGL